MHKISVEEKIRIPHLQIYKPVNLLPKYIWRVEIPRGGEFCISYTKDIPFMARVWMRFIGWGVKKL